MRQVLAEADCLHDADAVDAACERLATAIADQYAALDPLVICVMNGGLYATAAITARLRFPLEIDYLHATRYRGATSGGGLVWKVKPKTARLPKRPGLVIAALPDAGPQTARKQG